MRFFLSKTETAKNGNKEKLAELFSWHPALKKNTTNEKKQAQKWAVMFFHLLKSSCMLKRD